MINWLLLSLCAFFAGALLCLTTTGSPRLTRFVGPAVTVVGGLIGLVPTYYLLSGRGPVTVHMPWSIPFGSFALKIDALSAVFSTPIMIVSMLAAVYGAEYLRPYEGKKNIALSWFFFNLLVGSMLLVVAAQNAMIFLLAWELMSLSSFFLVMFEHEREPVRAAGWTYLVATHIGAAFLLVLFILLGRHSSTLDFAGFSVAPELAGIVFFLAVIGFGTKAGFIPVHIWLPEAHPAAPSHVSAVMSGVMIKTGIYGIIRILTFLPQPPPSWGWSLIAIGATSGILGVLFALAQSDLKRLLAYSSVENIGIIAMGLGVGMLGMSYHAPVVMFLGFAGCFLHVINHALFKSLLFLSAGSVIHASGTRNIDQMGGMLKRIPITAMVFLLGSLAICGFPPLNGFVSEFTVYLGAINAAAGDLRLPVSAMVAAPVIMGALALIGGLALACFAKAFGVIFLGEPRGDRAVVVHDCGMCMKIPMLLLSFCCIAMGLTGHFWINLLRPAISVATSTVGESSVDATFASNALWLVTVCAIFGIALAGIIALIRSRLLKKQTVTQAATWGCGYAGPTPRMQYTASSFVEPITSLFRSILRTDKHHSQADGFFPRSSHFSTETPDLFQNRLFRPAVIRIERLLSRIQSLQHGNLNLYILCILGALIVLLVWKLW